jgi:hypothetical protein
MRIEFLATSLVDPASPQADNINSYGLQHNRIRARTYWLSNSKPLDELGDSSTIVADLALCRIDTSSVGNKNRSEGKV